MTDERGHAAGSAGPRKSRRVGKGALLDCSRGQSRARAHSPAKTGVKALMAHAATVPRTILPTLQLCCASRGRRRHIPRDLCRLAILHGHALTVHRRAGQRMNSKNIATDSFARAGPRASATSTHRPLPQPKTKARQRSRRQGRRRVELGSNAARCPCSFPHSS